MQKLEVKKIQRTKEFFLSFSQAQWPTLMPVICEEKVAGKSGEQGKERQEWETESRSQRGAGSLLSAVFTFQLVIKVSNVVNMDMFNVNSGFHKLKMSTLSYACI